MRQLVGGVNERYVRYAETNSPTAAKPNILQRETFLFIAHPAVPVLKLL